MNGYIQTQPARQTQPQTRLLTAKHNTPISSTITIHDTTTSQPLYTVKSTGLAGKSHTYTSTLTGQPIAQTKMHSLSSKIDVTLHGHSFTIAPRSEWSLKEVYNYTSPAGARSWRNTRSWKRMGPICEDDTGVPLARVETPNGTLTRVGEFEVLGEACAGGILMDELVVTGLAVALRRICAVQSAVSGAV